MMKKKPIIIPNLYASKKKNTLEIDLSCCYYYGYYEVKKIYDQNMYGYHFFVCVGH